MSETFTQVAETFECDGVTFTLRTVSLKTTERYEDVYADGKFTRNKRAEMVGWVTWDLKTERVFEHAGARVGRHQPTSVTFRYERDGREGSSAEWTVAFMRSVSLHTQNVLKNGASGAEATLDEYTAPKMFRDVCEGQAWRLFVAAYH
jgi:hypothetical protein